MPVPRGPNFQPFARVEAPPRPKDAPVLAIGRRAIITRQGSRSERIALTDEAGSTTVGTITDGTQVEIVAWRPRRGDTRYRVISADRALEGWVDAANLKAAPPPPPPPPKVVVASTPAPRPTLPIQARGATARPRRSATPARAVSSKATAKATKAAPVASGKGAKLTAGRDRGRATPANA